MNITEDQLCGIIDHTFLKQEGTNEQIEKICRDALEYQFATVIVHPTEVLKVFQYLSGAEVKIGTVVGFPMGKNTTKVKVFETENAVDTGVHEIDMVINIGELIQDNTRYVSNEIREISNVCKRNHVILKVIIETCFLNKKQIELASRIVMDSGADFIKTSTGLATGGALVEDIRLIHSVVGDSIGIKASGGIRTLQSLLEMVDAGATRIGTSSGIDIVKEYRDLVNYSG